MAVDLVIPNAIVNGQPNDGSQVAANFTAIANWINANAVHLDGSKAFTAIPSGPGSDPTTANQFTRKAYVDAILPVGMMTAYGGSVAPAGWLLCQGQAVSRSTYSALFGVLGTTFGAGDGSTTFNLPDLRGRVPVGRDSGQTEFDTLGETGGSKTHTLSLAELPVHSHSIDHDHASVTTSSSGTHRHDEGPDTLARSTAGFISYMTGTPNWYNNTGANAGSGWEPRLSLETTDAGAHTHTVDLPNFTGTSGNAGSGSAHNNLQPYQVVNWIIKS